MAPKTVHRFNPIDLHNGVNVLPHDWIQEVIYYGESRLRKAVIAMSTPEGSKQGYFQEFLWSELVGLINGFG